jgi:hypothetical protein
LVIQIGRDVEGWSGHGVAEYRVLVADALPAALAEALPTVAEIETGIGLPQDD